MGYLFVICTTVVGLACAKVGSSGSGQDAGPGSGGSGPGGIAGGSPGSGGGSGGGFGGSVSASDAMACQQLEVNFEPKIPTVFVLVDRSGSMFDPSAGLPLGAWGPLRAGVLRVIEQLQADINFGFGAFTGQAGQTCPAFEKVDVAPNNYPAISALYSSLERTAYKGETPTMRVLPMVRDLLLAAPTPGERYILFVTDGQPDYCGDGNELCPVDGVVHQLQQLKTAGIGTFVFGLKSALTTISEATLQAFANAGAGQPVLVAAPSTLEVFNQCFYGGDVNAVGWKQDFMTAGRTMGMTLATYAAAGGTATVYKPDPANEKALADQIAAVVSGVKSCIFDLGGKIKVDLTQLTKAGVAIEGQNIPLSDANGWRMNTDTQLELVGSACTTWRDPTKRKIEFKFPCELIIVQ